MKKLLAVLIFVSLNCTITNITSNTTLEITQGDITVENVDAIVNAANDQLLGGAGVCGAIFKAAGWNQLQKACDQYPIKNDARCKVGKAKITDSFNLQKFGIKKIIHAVGPDCRIIKDKKEQEELLYSAYFNSLKLAEKNNLKSIAFPFISSGIYAFPKIHAAQIAIKAVKEYFTKIESKVIQVKFVLFSQEDFDIFTQN